MKVNKRNVEVLGLVVIFLWVFVGFFEQVNAQSPQPIKIGWAGPLTGPGAHDGAIALEGAKLAAKLINEKGGLSGRKVELLVEDDRALPEDSRRIAEKFYLRDKVHGMVSGTVSGPALTALEVARKYGGILMAPLAQTDRMTNSGYENVFAFNAAAAVYGKILGTFVAEKLKPKTIAMISENNELTRMYEKAMRDLWKEIGGPKIISVDYVSSQQMEFSSELTRINGLKPDALWIGLYGSPQTSKAWKQVKEFGIKAQIIAGPALLMLTSLELGAGYFDGTYTDEIYIFGLTHPENVAFVKAFQTAFGRKPDKMSLVNYEAVYCLALAIDKARSDDPRAIARALRTGLNWITPRGIKPNFDSGGRIIFQPFIYKIINNIPVKVEE
jgi:branched-chain amino acid transport system substrate-binding protein